jgi:two-component system response regulator PilR (NtrC family)
MAEILIVEDEDILRRNLVFILNNSGHSVVSAKNGEDAIMHLIKRRFDIVVTDLVMPLKGGSELVEYITENYPGTVVILITAYPSTESAIDALKHGVVDYITKPFDPGDLLASIEKAIEKRKEVPFVWERLKPYGLTRKEQEILRAIVEDGITKNMVLSERFSIKVSTIKQHLTNIYGKFGVTNRSSLMSAVIKAMRKPN